MKFRHTGGAGQRIEAQMAPLIDVVFLLLIFFMLTLKIVEPEGDFNINMPLATPEAQPSEEIMLPDIRVRLVAAADGSLGQLRLGQRELGNGPEAFDRLNTEILQIIGRPGGPMSEDVEVEIDADYALNYEHVISAVSACTGRLNEDTNRIVRYVEKIKFAPPRRPEGAGE